MEFSGAAMTPLEAELTIRELQPFHISDIGCEKWKNQREAVEQLNLCTHSNAVNKVDDYVKTFLIEHDKLSTVLHELLLMEAWRQEVLNVEQSSPSTGVAELLEAMSDNPTAVYLYGSYESVLVNLLECICFHEETLIGFGDDLLELVDYCWRQICFFFSLEKEYSQVQRVDEPHADAKCATLATLKQQHIAQSMRCLSLLWFVVDHVNALPLSVSNNLLNKQDVPVGLSEVLLLQPWQRRVRLPSGEVHFQKFKNGCFVDVETGETETDSLLQLCPPEAHVWFSLHKIFCEPSLRQRYRLTAHKKARILQIRRFFNETLLDQVPALAALQRALEELSFLQPPTGTESTSTSTFLLVEQVPRLMVAIQADLKHYHEHQQRTTTTVSAAAEAEEGEEKRKKKKEDEENEKKTRKNDEKKVEKEADWRVEERRRLTALLRDAAARARDAVRLAKLFDQMFC